MLQKQHIEEISEISEVRVVRIAEYINTVVATRKLPPGRGPGAVVMKLDVEGLEVEIVSDLIMSGAIAHLDNIHVDWETMKLNMEGGIYPGFALIGPALSLLRSHWSRVTK